MTCPVPHVAAKQRMGVLANILSRDAPDVTTYAGAARVLGGGAAASGMSSSACVAICRALLTLSNVLTPAPTVLVIRHIYHALTSRKLPFATSAARAEYWTLLAEIGPCTDGPPRPAALVTIATAGLTSGEVQERDAVARALCTVPTSIATTLEGHAALASAVLTQIRHPGIRPAALQIVRTYAEAQGRCFNPRRVMTAILDGFVNAALTSWSYDQELSNEAMDVACQGIFMSTSGVVEKYSYFTGLYEWIRETVAAEHLSRLADLLVRWCVSSTAVTFNDDSGASSDWHISKLRKVNISSESRNQSKSTVSSFLSLTNNVDGTGILPQNILIPLTFFKHLLDALTIRLKETQDLKSRRHLFEAFRVAFEVASRCGIYRFSYDSRPTTRAAEKVAAEVPNTTVDTATVGDKGARKGKKRKDYLSAKIVEGRELGNEGTTGESILHAFQAISSCLTELGQVWTGQTVAGSESQLLRDEANCQLEHVFKVGCHAISSALELSLDIVMKDSKAVKSILRIAESRISLDILEGISDVFATIIETHAATRQLPMFCSQVLSGEKPRSQAFCRLWEVKHIRGVLVRAVSTSPRGHSAQMLRNLISDDPETIHVPQLAIILALILESVPISEHSAIVEIVEHDIMPLLKSEDGVRTHLQSVPYCLEMFLIRSSVLYLMGFSGMSLTISLFDGILYPAEVVQLMLLAECGDSSARIGNDCDKIISKPTEGENTFKYQRHIASQKLEYLVSFGMQWHIMPVKLASASNRVVYVDSLSHHLRYFVSLAHLCYSDRLVDNSTDYDAKNYENLLPVILKECWLIFDRLAANIGTESADCVSKLSEIGASFVTLRTAFESTSCRCVQLGASLVELIRSSEQSSPAKCGEELVVRICLGKPQFVSDDAKDFALNGFTQFVSLALMHDDTFDSVWDELWECDVVQKVFVSAFCMLLRRFKSTMIVCSALERALKIPHNYLSETDELELGRHCAKLLQSKSQNHDIDETDKQAIRVLSRRRIIASDVIGNAHDRWLKAALQTSGCEDLLVTLTRSGILQDESFLSRLENHLCIAGLSGLSWFMRAATRLLDVTIGERNDIEKTLKFPDSFLLFLLRIVVALEANVTEIFKSTADDAGQRDAAFNSTIDLIKLGQLMPCSSSLDPQSLKSSDSSLHSARKDDIRNVANDDTAFGAAKVDVHCSITRLLRLALPQCCTANRDCLGGISASAVALLCAVFDGTNPTYMLLVDQRENWASEESAQMSVSGFLMRVAAVSLNWIGDPFRSLSSAQCSTGLSSRTAGEMVLTSLVNHHSGKFSRALITAISQAVLEQFAAGRTTMVFAARVLLSSKQTGWHDARILIAAMRAVVHMDSFKEAIEPPAATVTRKYEITDGELGASLPGFRRQSLDADEEGQCMLAAVAGVEAWVKFSRHRGLRSIPDSISETVLQLLARICNSRLAKEYQGGIAVVSSLHICDLLVRKQQDIIKAAPMSSKGVLWAVQRLLSATLSDPGMLNANMFGAVARVHETVCESARNEGVCCAMLRDVCIALSGACTAGIRCAAAGSVSVLGEKAGEAGVKMVASSLDDAGKEILRSLREEALTELKYKGRA